MASEQAVAWHVPENPEDVRHALDSYGYLSDVGLSTAIFLALRLQRPLFLEGEPGVGKTEVANVLSLWTGSPLIRLQCYEGIDASQAVYEWDYARQLLHLRATETRGDQRETQVVEDELFSERFLIRRAVMRAITDGPDDTPNTAPKVLLIDELDRSDDEFEAFLLEILSDYSVTVPELGTFHATVPPIVVITSNRTRDVHDALKRRALYHWVEHPDFEREVAIVQRRAPEVSESLVTQVTAAVQKLREFDLYKAPGVAETIDWARALVLLGESAIDERVIADTLGTVLKYREDLESVLSTHLRELVGVVTSNR